MLFVFLLSFKSYVYIVTKIIHFYSHRYHMLCQMYDLSLSILPLRCISLLFRQIGVWRELNKCVEKMLQKWIAFYDMIWSLYLYVQDWSSMVKLVFWKKELHTVFHSQVLQGLAHYIFTLIEGEWYLNVY